MANNRTTQQQLREAYHSLTQLIGEAAQRRGRNPRDILMVAVTKNATPDQIRMIVDMGHADLGENRVQQLIQRVATLEESLARRRTFAGGATTAGNPMPHVRWHMIGHLQRNKIKQVMPLVTLIHSLDTLRLAEEIQVLGGKADRITDVMIQVNISGEETKFGVAMPAVPHLAEQLDSMIHLRLRGLMTMAPYSDNPEDARPHFARMKELFDEIRGMKIGGRDFNLLSMGMSGDFQVAIEEGANIVRIGSALFGAGGETG